MHLIPHLNRTAICIAFAEILHLLREKKEGVEGEMEER